MSYFSLPDVKSLETWAVLIDQATKSKFLQFLWCTEPRKVMYFTLADERATKGEASQLNQGPFIREEGKEGGGGGD